MFCITRIRNGLNRMERDLSVVLYCSVVNLQQVSKIPDTNKLQAVSTLLLMQEG